MTELSMGQKVLAQAMGRNDAHAATVRDYLKALVQTVWTEEEGFSGKRPFGNSGWRYEIEAALVKAGLCEEGDRDRADELVAEAIAAL